MSYGRNAESGPFFAGQNVDVDSGVASQLTDTSNRAYHRLVIKALPANTGVICIGADNTVSSTTGFPLSASESIAIPVTDPSLVWVIASADNQGVAWYGQ